MITEVFVLNWNEYSKGKTFKRYEVCLVHFTFLSDGRGQYVLSLSLE